MRPAVCQRRGTDSKKKPIYATYIADICCIADNCYSAHLDRCALPLVYAAHIRFLHAVTTGVGLLLLVLSAGRPSV